MLSIRLDSEVPLVEQIVCGLRAEIANESLAPGAELPSVRQLAADLGINLNTVARAYRILQQTGLVHSARGRGTRVTSSREFAGQVQPGLHASLGERARSLFSDAKLGGLSLAEAKALMARELDLVWALGGNG